MVFALQLKEEPEGSLVALDVDVFREGLNDCVVVERRQSFGVDLEFVWSFNY